MGDGHWATGRHDDGLTVALNIHITPELEAEGIARDLIRHIQRERKAQGMKMQDRIAVVVATDDDKVIRAIESHTTYIREETRAGVLFEVWPNVDGKPIKVGGQQVGLSVFLEDQ